MNESQNPRKRKVLCLEDKAAIIAAVSRGEKKKDVALRFGIAQSSLSTILKEKEKIMSSVERGSSSQRKKVKRPSYEEIEKAAFAWFLDVRARNVPVSGAMLIQKAKDFGCMLGCDDFKASNGWLQNFKARHQIVGKVTSGESASADVASAASWNEECLPHVLSSFDPADIYNADESGLFFQMLPKRTLALKGEACHGGKQSKLRITVLMCTNMDGSDKRAPLVIGYSKKPRSFSNAKRLPVEYVSNKKAWMTRDIFARWLRDFDEDMRRRQRKICLFLDNCTAHHVEDLVLSNIKLQYFPANCTSVIQPLDQGVINSVKCAYRNRVLSKMLLDIRLNRNTKVDVYQAVEMLAASWVATSASIIRNCFRKAGFVLDHALASLDDSQNAESISPELVPTWQSLSEFSDVVPDGTTLDDYVNSDASVVATEELDDAEIVRSVRDGGGSDMEDGDEAQQDEMCDVPSGTQVLDAIDVLRRYALAQQNIERAVEAIWSYERVVIPAMQQQYQTKMRLFYEIKFSK
ncbi:tigger transposable element-derived protein 6-like [Ornithodoros turicata]|uniref:tigger transposable element-derived protein 6-like n=1 Tax=Ornithodoros turicata TaxID=34597 RepID=UPI003139764A